MDDDRAVEDGARRLLIVGNSVSLPPAPGIAAYPERLADMMQGRWIIDTLLRSGETIEQMEADILAALAARPSRLVLQVGINECAPRPLGARERDALGRLRPLLLRGLIIRMLHRYRPQIIRARRLQQFTPLPRFVDAVTRILAAARRVDCRVLILPITTVTAVAERRTPFTNREVARYNEALRISAGNTAAFASQHELFADAPADDLCATPETVHLSGAAHQRIAEFVAAWVTA